jgi:hypothetical protein
MGLTRLRAEQISDIDYKQAVRVITVTNVTLSGGAPSQVDGVNLSVSDRILVNGQTTGSQNGIYQVQTVGTGSNGTWIRSIDTNQTGELEAGTIVMVTEGTAYKDTQWKLTTNNPIVIGTTPLTFEQNSAFAFGNIYANGTAVLANTVGDVLTLTAGNNIQITSNNTAKSVTIGVTGISLNSISNGTSNVNVVSSGGNVTVGIGGTSNVAEFSTVGLKVTGFISATGNVTGGNITTAGLVTATGNVTGGNIITAGSVFVTTNISATGNVRGGNINTGGLVTATGNVTGGNITTAGLVTATGNIDAGNIRTAGLITATGNLISGNLLTSGLISATGNLFAGNAVLSGNLTVNGNVTYINSNVVTINDLAINLANNAATAVAANGGGIEIGPQGSPYITWLYNNSANTFTSSAGISAVGNIAGANLTTAGLVTATGNITGGNILTSGLVSATGNVTGNFFNGNGSALTGINSFSNILVTGGNSIIADSISDTLTITAGTGISIVADAATDTLTIATSSGSEIFVDGADFGTVTEPVTQSDDLGLVTESVTAQSDLGELVISGLIYPNQFVLPTYTVAQLANVGVTPAGQMVYVSNESGGAVPAFSDGTNWRRVTDRQIVS